MSPTPGRKRVAVLGCRGMLGTDVMAALAARGYLTAGYDLPQWDLRDEPDRAAAVGGADAVVNCAAYTDVDGAERDPETAEAVNAAAVGELGRLAASTGCHLIHISTDFVYDGCKAGPYTEADAARPLNQYGRTKLAGERYLRESGCHHAVVRLAWTYGLAGQHFVSKFLARARGAGTVRVVSDQVGSPTWTADAAAAIAQALAAGLQGLYLYAAAGCASRFDIAVLVAAELGLQTEVTPCRTADFEASAQRPLNSVFDCTAIESALGPCRRPWDEALRDYLRQAE